MSTWLGHPGDVERKEPGKHIHCALSAFQWTSDGPASTELILSYKWQERKTRTHQLHIAIPRRRDEGVFPHIRPIHAEHFLRVFLPSADCKVLTLAL